MGHDHVVIIGLTYGCTSTEVHEQHTPEVLPICTCSAALLIIVLFVLLWEWILNQSPYAAYILLAK